VLALLAALALAACGGEPPPDPRAGEVVRAIQSFAAADGPRACDLLTEAAVVRLYGGRAGCLSRSRGFEVGEVKVEEVAIAGNGMRATAEARSVGGSQRFTVVAQLVMPPGCRPPCPEARWRIDSVKPA
jgi:hypothetical protein